MPKFQFEFSGRVNGALGAYSNHWRTVEAPNREAAQLKLYETHEHIRVIRCVELVTRYAITHVNKDGARTLTFANQGQNHYDTRDAAERALKVFVDDGSLRAKVLHEMADTLAVRPFDCYGHGDAVGIFFHGPVYRKVDELGGYVVNSREGHEATFVDKLTADKFVEWMAATKRACSDALPLRSGRAFYVIYDSKLDHDHEE